ncbi:MAG: ChbG/HpnK family deacetylase [Pseudorhodoplanes sp.]
MAGLKAKRKIWLCADDYGIAPGVSAAIRDLIGHGRLNATSVMVVSPHFSQGEAGALAAIASGQNAALGLHFTLTAPFRPLSPSYGPTQDDAFLSLGATLQRSLMRRLEPNRLSAEFEAQLKTFIDVFGRPPDFIDGHQHVQLFPQIRDAVLAGIRKYAPQAWLRQCGRVRALRGGHRDRKALLLDILSVRLRKRARDLQIATNPAFAGTYSFSPHADFAALFPTFLEGLPDGGLVMCHPGKVDADLVRLDPLTTLREAEYAYFAGEAFPKMLEARGFKLI